MADTPTVNVASSGPSPAEARRRSGLFHQAFRFVVLNLKIFRLTRQHH